MSDFVLGALVGIVGTIAASTVSGLISYKTAKLQANARLDELDRQLKHQKEESRRDRLIEARKGYLLPLRDIISQWIVASNNSISMAIRVQMAGEKANKVELREELRKAIDVWDESAELSKKLQTYHGKISDAELDRLIEVAKNAESDTGLERMGLVQLFNNPGDIDINFLKAAFKKYESILQEVRSKLFPINKRIEELLSGEPSV